MEKHINNHSTPSMQTNLYKSYKLLATGSIVYSQSMGDGRWKMSEDTFRNFPFLSLLTYRSWLWIQSGPSTSQFYSPLVTCDVM